MLQFHVTLRVGPQGNLLALEKGVQTSFDKVWASVFARVYNSCRGRLPHDPLLLKRTNILYIYAHNSMRIKKYLPTYVSCMHILAYSCTQPFIHPCLP